MRLLAAAKELPHSTAPKHKFGRGRKRDISSDWHHQETTIKELSFDSLGATKSLSRVAATGENQFKATKQASFSFFSKKVGRSQIIL